MRMKKYILFFIISISAHGIIAQEYYFREYLTTPVLVNPALMAIDSDAAIFINYRNQNIGPDYSLHTSKVSFKYPILGNNNVRRGAVGVAFLDDRAGNHSFLQLQAVIPSLAYNLNFKENHHLSFALNAAFYRQSLDQELLKTGMQYVPERGFVSNLPSGENFISDFQNYTGIDFGILWYYQERNITDAWLGFSVINMNRPGISLLSANTVRAPVRININGGVNLLNHQNAALITDFLLSHHDGRTSLFYGGKLEYFLASDSESKVLSAGIHHAWDKSMVFSAGLRQQSFSFNFNYEVDLGSNNEPGTPFYNATEYALVLKKTITSGNRKSKNKRRKSNQSTIIQTARKKKIQLSILENTTSDSSKSINENLITEKKEPSPPDTLVSDKKEVIKNETRILGSKKCIHFDFNSTKIKNESYVLLEQIIKMMQKNGNLNIILLGHTDNIGSESANLIVSKKRAESIAEFLMENGIEKSRIKTVGKGEQQPLNDNSTLQKQAENRRVEFIIF